MKFQLIPLALLLICSQDSFATPRPEDPCVPDGGSSDTCGDRPDLIGPGMPVGGNLRPNGGAEGNCIEVKICWTFYYPVTITIGYRGSYGHGSQTVTVWRRGKICSDPKEICPC